MWQVIRQQTTRCFFLMQLLVCYELLQRVGFCGKLEEIIDNAPASGMPDYLHVGRVGMSSVLTPPQKDSH